MESIQDKQGKEYKLSLSGTAYNPNTPDEVINALEYSRKSQVKVKIYYGDVETGRNWNEERDTIGIIGRSCGDIKIPILLSNSGSIGGVGVLDHCIIKIKTTSGNVLYQAYNFQESKFEIFPSDLPEYAYNVHINGKLYSRHKTERSAKILISKLS